MNNGEDRYKKVKAVEKRILSQGKWRKKGERITQNTACSEVGISTHQYRKWKSIIEKNRNIPIEEVYGKLNDKRYASNRTTPTQEQVVIDHIKRFPGKSFRKVAEDLEGKLGKKLHHSTISRIYKDKN